MGVSKLVCSHLQLRHLMLLCQTEEPEVYPLSTAILEAEIPFWTNQIARPSSFLFIAMAPDVFLE